MDYLNALMNDLISTKKEIQTNPYVQEAVSNVGGAFKNFANNMDERNQRVLSGDKQAAIDTMMSFGLIPNGATMGKSAPIINKTAYMGAIRDTGIPLAGGRRVGLSLMDFIKQLGGK